MNRRQFLHASLATSISAAATGGVALAQERSGGLRAIEKARPLTVPQRRILDQHGLVMLKDGLPSFGTAYEWLYSHDLPLFVSADSILHAVHRGYDDILKLLELEALVPALETVLTAMRRDLAGGTVLAGLTPQTIADVDLYLAVAASLLKGEVVAGVAGADPAQLAQILQAAEQAAGMVTMFGDLRLVDASQFKPRGHYQDQEVLRRYFRAMMWLGRIDFRLLEQLEGRLVFQRAQFDAAVALRLLMDQPTHEAWLVLDWTIGQFVGPYDSISPPLLDDLMAELEIDGPERLMALSDAEIRAALEALPGGEQQILSHLVEGGDQETAPMSRTFLLLGQRYVIDSHVFSLLVYDRVGGGTIPRLMPSPLDVAYAVLGNEQALTELSGELRRYGYEADLAQAREMVEARAGWEDTLYDLWLAALRTLSQAQADAPAVARSEAWQRRILNTQLASWAELRRDTILYAKQSYTSMILCEHPDAWVDPYPEFYAAIQAYAGRGLELVERLALSKDSRQRVAGVFSKLREVATHLEGIARGQVHGERIRAEDLRFINEVVRSRHEGCGALVGAEGWYPQLFLHSLRSMEYDPTIADVHTQPTDEAGNMVGRVLHVATGKPRLCVVMVDTCDGPRAYAGVVSSYHEKITEDFQRLDDQEWGMMLGQEKEGPPPPWVADLIG